MSSSAMSPEVDRWLEVLKDSLELHATILRTLNNKHLNLAAQSLEAAQHWLEQAAQHRKV